VVLLGGTAQWVDSWIGHISALARERRVLVYETAGQGGASSSLDVSNSSLFRHADDFSSVLDASGLLGNEASDKVDVVAFSFGARVAMAAAATTEAGRIRRLCLTGVSADRGDRGRRALSRWGEMLWADDLEGFARQLIEDTYSPKFLEVQEDRVEGWVSAIVNANSVEGLRAIVEQTHTDDPTDPTHPSAMARAIRCAGQVEAGLLLFGEEDALAAEGSVGALADAAGWQHRALSDAAHAAPIEQAVVWQKEVIRFLDAMTFEVTLPDVR
jgi:pimeloyl-ACP methyl ester carboxylesterase